MYALNHRIQQFDVQGRYEKTVIKNLYYPCCIRTNKHKDLFIVDQVKSAIVVVDCKHKGYVFFGERELLRPTSVVCVDDDVFVCDSGNKRLVKFIFDSPLKTYVAFKELTMEELGIDDTPISIDISLHGIVMSMLHSRRIYFISLSYFD